VSYFPQDLDFALAGSTPSPIPTANTSEVQSFIVGRPITGLAGPYVPWLDAMLDVQNVTADQAAREVLPNIRQSIAGLGSQVDSAAWVAGGHVHVVFRPNAPHPAIGYATTVRDALLEGGRSLGANPRIILHRYRVDMPELHDDLYVYPTPTAAAAPTPSGPAPVHAPPPAGPVSTMLGPGAQLGSPAMIAAAVGGVVVLGGVGYYFSRRRVQMRANRIRRNRRRTR